MSRPSPSRSASSSSSQLSLHFDGDGIPHFQHRTNSPKKQNSTDDRLAKDMAEAERKIREAEEEHERSTLDQLQEANSTRGSEILQVREKEKEKEMEMGQEESAQNIVSLHQKPTLCGHARRTTVTATTFKHRDMQDVSTPTMASPPRFSA